MHRLFENPAAVFITLELIKAGTGWSKENNVARHSKLACSPDCILQSLGVFDLCRSLNLRFDLGSRGPNCINALHALPQTR